MENGVHEGKNEEKELQEIIMEFRRDRMGFAQRIFEEVQDLELELVSLLNEARDNKATNCKTEVVCNDNRWKVWNETIDGIQQQEVLGDHPQKVPEHKIDVLEHSMEYNYNGYDNLHLNENREDSGRKAKIGKARENEKNIDHNVKIISNPASETGSLTHKKRKSDKLCSITNSISGEGGKNNDRK